MTRWRCRYLRAITVVAALTSTAACTGPGRIDITPSPSVLAFPPPPVLSSGIVAVVTGPSGASLRLFDARSGRQMRSIALPTDKVSVAQFSPDWSWLVWLTPNTAWAGSNSKFVVAELRGDAYVQTAVVDATGFGLGTTGQLTSTQFVAATGQLLVGYHVALSGEGYGGGSLVVDPRHPEAKPARIPTDLARGADRYGDPIPSQENAGFIAGQPTLRVRIVATKRELISAYILDPPRQLPNGGQAADFAYECNGPALDPSEIACQGDTRVGALALLIRGADPTLRQLIAPGGPPIQRVLPSPDRSQLLVQRANGWIVVRADGSGPPQPAFDALQADQSEKVSVLAWI